MIKILKKNYVKARLVVLFLGLVLFFISFSQSRSLFLESSNVRKNETALAEIKRLLVLTIQHSKSKPLPSAENVWKEFGMQGPSLDPWHSAYRMELGADYVIWRSAGSDGSFSTSDDIFFKIPFNFNNFPEPNESQQPQTAPAISAK